MAGANAQDDLRDYLAANVAGLTEGSNLFSDYDPAASVDPVICTYGYAGQAPEYTHDKGRALEFPRVQVIARSQTASAAWGLALSAYAELDGANQVFGSQKYGLVRPMQYPFPIERDAANRAQIVFNIRCTRSA